MDNEQYNLVFSGQLVPGFDLAQVKRNLQVLFRIDDAKVEQLFSGKATVLKKGLDAEAANKYRVAMKKAGARVDLVAGAPSSESAGPDGSVKKEAPIGAATEHVGVAAGTPSQATTRPARPGWSLDLGAQPASPPVPLKPIQAPDFEIAAPGADILNPHEKTSVVPVSVDLSGLAVVEQGGDLLQPGERKASVPPSVQLPELDVLPVGSDLLDPADRSDPVAPPLDLSGLKLAPAGERLSPPGKEPPRPPPVDHLSLQK